jgi:hypothetical protein
VTATLRGDLIFDVQTRGACLDKGAEGARNVERSAPTGIRIHEQRQGAGIGDAANVDEHLVHRQNTEARHDECAREKRSFRACQLSFHKFHGSYFLYISLHEQIN